MIKKIILDSGLELILNQDKNKHRTIADLYIKAGGFDNEFYYDNKFYLQPRGVAHFLEHYLLEHSMYGNIMNYFGKEYIKSNGLTSIHKTNFYINTVHDFKDNLLRLLNVVNKPSFSAELIEDTKQPILAEINRKNDNKYDKLYGMVLENTFENKIYNINLGDSSDILNMTIQDIELFYNAFYQPSNQILVLTGNFDDDIVDFINDFYNNLNKEYKNFKKIDIKEPDSVVNKDVTVNSDVNEELFILGFKINISKLTPLEKNKLDYYISYIYESNFGGKSELLNYLFKNKITNHNISFNLDAELIKDYLFVSLYVTTSKIDETVKLIFETFNDLTLNEEDFTRWINNRIISIINRYEYVGAITRNYLDNLFFYDLEGYDDVEFLKSLNLNELKELINKLDLSNYSIVRNVVE